MAAVPPPADQLIDQASRLLVELDARGVEPELTARTADTLAEGYAVALALEGARRRLRERALDLTQLELGLVARERELRAALDALRERLRGSAASGREPASQRLD